MKQQYQVKLSDEERSQLNRLTTVGKAKVRKLKRAHILLQADLGKPDQAIAERVDVSLPTVGRIRRQYVTEGLEAALNEKARSGRPQGISAKTRATITALACSPAPPGHERWTLRLLSDKIVELECTDSISHQSVHLILKKMNLSLT